MKFPKPQELAKIITQLSKREKFFLYAAALVLALTMFDRLVINPIFSKIASLEKETGEKESDIKNMLLILSQKDKIASEKTKYNDYLNNIRFKEEEVSNLLKEIESLASKDSVYLIDLKPQGFKEGAGVLNKYVVSVSCEAQMEQLIQFMYDIESSNYLITIAKLQLSPKSKESSLVSCVMSLYKLAI